MKTYQTMLAAAGATLVLTSCYAMQGISYEEQYEKNVEGWLSPWSISETKDEFSDEKKHTLITFGPKRYNQSQILLFCKEEGNEPVDLYIHDGELSIERTENIKFRINQNEAFSGPGIKLNNVDSGFWVLDQSVKKRVLQEMKNGSNFGTLTIQIGSNLPEKFGLGGFKVRMEKLEEKCPQITETQSWLGVGYEQATRGAALSWIQPNGPANASGLLVGDVILTFAGRQIIDYRTLQRIMAETEPGTTVEMKVLRSGQTITLEAVIGSQRVLR